MEKLRSNIYKVYILHAIQFFMVFVPIIVLFYQHHGLSMAQILTVQAVFSITVVVFQIPTGYFADVIGRKKSLIFGFTIAPLGYLIYSFSSGFWGFLLAEFTLGLASSFISGADSALIYDSLVQLKEEGKYKLIEGKYGAISGAAEATASILGGFLALVSLNFPLYVETAIAFLGIPIALSLAEPKIHKEEFHKEKTNTLKKIGEIVKFSVHGHKEVKWLIIYSSALGAATLNMVWFTQVFEKNVGVPLALFGVVWASFLVSFSIFSLFSEKYERTFGRRNSLISLILLVAAGYFLVGLSNAIWGIAFIYIFYFVRGVHDPIIKDYINKLIPSDIRATVMSVRSMVIRIVFAIVGPFIGWINDLYSFQTALIVAGLTFLALGLISLFFLHLNNALTISNGENKS